MDTSEVTRLIKDTISNEVDQNDYTTSYRAPIIGYVSADDPRFVQLSSLTGFRHLIPDELLPGARSVVCFFLPFAPEIAYANTRDKERVAREWALAYQETNALIEQITSRLKTELSRCGVRSAAEPPTGNYTTRELRSHWSHKSIAVLTGIGSFGLNHLVITDSGCAGRFGSLVIDTDVSFEKPEPKERCEYYVLGTCMDCIKACPVSAISEDGSFDRRVCWQQLQKNIGEFLDIGYVVKVCGKCAVMGPCALEAGI
jgi:epoxyqueuosine reductase QueG